MALCPLDQYFCRDIVVFIHQFSLEYRLWYVYQGTQSIREYNHRPLHVLVWVAIYVSSSVSWPKWIGPIGKQPDYLLQDMEIGRSFWSRWPLKECCRYGCSFMQTQLLTSNRRFTRFRYATCFIRFWARHMKNFNSLMCSSLSLNKVSITSTVESFRKYRLKVQTCIWLQRGSIWWWNHNLCCTTTRLREATWPKFSVVPLPYIASTTLGTSLSSPFVHRFAGDTMIIIEEWCPQILK